MAIQPDNPGNDPGNQPKTVQETVPEWLQALLQKYNQQQGPIAGLSGLYAGPAAQLDMGDTDDSISDVLEDIASDTPKPQTGKLASSVDWGVAPNPEPTPSNAMDDLLASFGEPDLEGNVSTEETPISSPPTKNEVTPPEEEAEQTPQMPQEIEAPDWLSNLDSSANTPVEASAPIEPAPDASWDSQEIPDWLNEIEDDPQPIELPSDAEMPALTDDFTAQDDTPDWLLDFSATEETALATGASVAGMPDDDDDAPDWLSDFTASHQEVQAQTEEMSDFTASPDATPAESPNLESLFSDASSVQTDQTDDDLDVPDWLSAIEQPDMAEPEPVSPLDSTASTAEPESPDTDDWLSQLSVGSGEETSPTFGEDAEADWLSDLTQPSADISSQEIKPDLPSDEEEDDDDWFQTVLQHYPVDPALTTDIDTTSELDSQAESLIGMPSSLDQVLDQTDEEQWLADLDQEGEADSVTTKTGVTNWLDQLQTDEDAGSASSEIASSDSDEDADSDDWLSPLADESRPFDFSGPDEADDAPEWLLGMQAADEVTDTSPGLSDSQANLERLDDSFEEAELPDWLAGIEDDDADNIAAKPDDVNADDQPEAISSLPTGLAGWLTESEGPTVTPEADETGIVDEDEALNWLTDADEQPQPDEVVQAADSGDATSASETASDAESDDWLEDVESAAKSATQVGLPSWIAGLANAEQLAAQGELEARFSVSADDLSDESMPVGSPEPTSTPETDDTPSARLDMAEKAEAEPITPDASTTEESSSYADAGLADADQMRTEDTPEIPDWMSALVENIPDADLDDSPTASTEDDIAADIFPAAETPSNIAEPDASDWLSSLRTELSAEETTDIDAESSSSEWPDWMANLQAADDDDTPESISDDSGQMEDQSDWLNRLSSTEIDNDNADETTPDVEVVPAIPDWMSALSAARDETVEFEETDQEDVSDWLSNLQADVPTDSDVSDDTIEAEKLGSIPDIPDWMENLAEDDFLEPEATTSVDDDDIQTENMSAEDEAKASASKISSAPADDLDQPEGILPDWMTSLEADTTLDSETNVSDESMPAEDDSSADDLRETPTLNEEAARFEEVALDELDEVTLDADLTEMITPLTETPDSNTVLKPDVEPQSELPLPEENEADLAESAAPFIEPIETDLAALELDWMSDLLPEAETGQPPEPPIEADATDNLNLPHQEVSEAELDTTEISASSMEDATLDVDTEAGESDGFVAEADTRAVDDVTSQFEEVEELDETLPDWMLKLEADLANEIASQQERESDDAPADISLPIIESESKPEKPALPSTPAPADNLSAWLAELGALGSDDNVEFALPDADEAVDLTSDPLSRLSNFFEDSLPESEEPVESDLSDQVEAHPEIENVADFSLPSIDEGTDSDFTALVPDEPDTDETEADSDDEDGEDDEDDENPPTDGGASPDDDDPDPSPLAGLFSGAGLRRRTMLDDEDDESGSAKLKSKLNILSSNADLATTPALESAAQRFFDIAAGSPENKIFVQANAEQWQWPWFGRLLRAALYLAFMVILTIPLFYHYDRGGFPFPWLEPSPGEQQDIRNNLQSVVGDKLPGSLALVSFDYTPANAGEMTPLAVEVIKKLRGQGMRIVTISLDPEGAMMAQQILSLVEPDGYGADVLNLGYLPGDIIAIRQLSFANPFQKLVDFKSKQPYNQLNNWPLIEGLTDIALIVTLSAMPDRLQWWAEQLNSTDHPPMLAVASSSAEPFIGPYIATGQFDAVIAGISGAAALESARVQEKLGAASRMLDSQSLAHLIIMILMLAGTMTGWFTKYGQEAV